MYVDFADVEGDHMVGNDIAEDGIPFLQSIILLAALTLWRRSELRLNNFLPQ